MATRSYALMRRDWFKVFISGMIGAAVMSILLGLGMAFRLWPLSLEMLLGNIITGRVGVGTWILGFAWHLINGGIFALVYASIFRVMGQAGLGIGALMGLGHWFFDGLFLQVLQTFAPNLPPVAALGPFFWSTQSSGPFWTSLFVHLAFGTIVGGVFRPAVPLEPGENIPEFHDTTYEFTRRRGVGDNQRRLGA